MITGIPKLNYQVINNIENQINDKYLFASHVVGNLLHDYKMYRDALQSLTPGGSEYIDDPVKCLQYIREKLQNYRLKDKALKYALDEIKHLKEKND